MAGNIDFKARKRDDAIKWAQGIREKKPLYLDFETTGLSSDAEIVEVAVTDHEGRPVFMSLCKPCGRIEPGASEVHGITDDRVKNAPEFENVHRILSILLSGSLVVIYNVNFEIRMIRQMERMRKLPEIDTSNWIDAMNPFAEFVGEWNAFRNNFKWQKLPGGDHSAFGDCVATVRLIERMASALKQEELPF